MLSHQTSAESELSRVVVLGATGFIASRLVQLLRSSQIPCRPIGSAEVDLVKCDATRKLRQIVQPTDSIVVLSALTPEKGRDRTTFLKNVTMIDSLCTVVVDAPCSHIAYISSDSVYDCRVSEIDEQCCCESNDMYALSHIVREKLLADACQDAKVDLAIIRPSAVYGAGDTHNSYGPNRFMRTALAEGKITLFGQGEEERDHLYIGDLCRLIQLCLLHRSSGVLNAVNGTALSFREVARRITEAIRREVVLETAPRRMPIVHRRFNTSAMKMAFPHFCSTPFHVGVRAALAELIGNV